MVVFSLSHLLEISRIALVFMIILCLPPLTLGAMVINAYGVWGTRARIQVFKTLEKPTKTVLVLNLRALFVK